MWTHIKRWIKHRTQTNNGAVGATKNVLAIELGLDYCKLLVLQLQNNSHLITAYTNICFTDHDQQHYEPKQSPCSPTITNVIVEKLKTILHHIQPACKKHRLMVVVGIPYNHTLDRSLYLPADLTIQELTSFLQINAEPTLGQPLAQLQLNHRLLISNAVSDKRTPLRLIAANKQYITNCRNLINTANLQPKIADVNTFALARAVKFLSHDQINNAVLMCIKATSLLLCCLTTEDVINIQEEHVIELATLQSKLDLINKHLNHYLEQLSHKPQQIIVTGELANLAGLINSIAGNTDIHVTTLKPNNNIQTTLPPASNSTPDLEKLVNDAIICLGLALRGKDEDYQCY